MRGIIVILIISVFGFAVSEARVNSTRKGINVQGKRDTASLKVDSMTIDAVAFEDRAVVMRGYSKLAGATKETFMLTNNTNHYISQVEISFKYTDINGVLLHERTELVKCELPPYSSRQASIKSWDEGHKFYYYKGKSRKDAIAYDVKVRVNRYDVRVERK